MWCKQLLDAVQRDGQLFHLMRLQFRPFAGCFVRSNCIKQSAFELSAQEKSGEETTNFGGICKRLLIILVLCVMCFFELEIRFVFGMQISGIVYQNGRNGGRMKTLNFRWSSPLRALNSKALCFQNFLQPSVGIKSASH